MMQRKGLSGHNNKKMNHSSPLENIIEKFHKIKEEKFKPKDRNPYLTSTVAKSGQKVSQTDKKLPRTLKKIDRESKTLRPFSAHLVQEQQTAHSNGRRRMSLPSLFHPITPLPAKTESAESVERLAHDVEEIVAHEGRRRHSVAHVIVEYSKHDLEHLSKIHEMKLQELNNAKTAQDKPSEKEQEVKPAVKELPLWMNGEDLHAFYNMWENKNVSERKRRPHIKKKLPLPNEDEEGDSDYERPRVFSF